MQHLGTAIAPPSDVQTTNFLGRAPSPASRDCSQLAARGPAVTPKVVNTQNANPRPFYILHFGPTHEVPQATRVNLPKSLTFDLLTFWQFCNLLLERACTRITGAKQRAALT